MTLLESLVVFVVGLLIGALGIYTGARLLTDRVDYTYAIVTALIATVVWVVVAFVFGWIPLLGPLLALVAYITVINLRYPGGWATAIGIALVAWVASFVVLFALALVGVTTFDAIGVAGV